MLKNSFTARAKTLFHFWDSPKIRRRPKRKTVQKLKIAWRLCYSRKPFRELYPRMRTPERGQLEAYTIWMPKPPRGFSGQLRHSVTCPRLDLLYQTTRHCARGESKKLLEAAKFLCIFPIRGRRWAKRFVPCLGWIPDSLHQCVRS